MLLKKIFEKMEGSWFDPGSGHSKFFSAKGIYLSIGSEIARLIADSVSKDSFLIVLILEISKIPLSNQMISLV